MSKYQTPTPAPGDEDLPDLILRGAGRQAHTYPKAAETLPLDLLQQQTSRFETTPYEPTYSAIDKASCTVHDMAQALAPFIFQLHHGHDTTGQQNDWLARQNPACCASCPNRSLARRPAAAAALLDAFDKHDPYSYSDHHHPIKLLQQHLMSPHHFYSSSSSGDTTLPPSSHQHQHQQHSKHANFTPPMLRRWFRQAPRQECFSGLAAAVHAAQASTLGAIKSRL